MGGIYMLFKHIDFESKEENHLDFKKAKKRKTIIMVGSFPEEQKEQVREEVPSDTDNIAKQILDSLEKGEQ
ncbi:hypothetical protein ACFL5G_03515 [Candidatus Margulisiibacteriota bacterium]